MVIFYTASYFGKKKYQEYYDLVINTLKEFDISLIATETGNYKDLLSERVRLKLSDNPKLLHYEAIRQGIHQADAIVLEVSNEDFQVGQEAMFAISEKKPVLALSVNEDLSKRIFNDYFFGAQYTKTTIKPIIQDFLSKVRQLTLTKRFNMFLYPHQIEYLKKASKKEGVNVSEYIRKLINIDKRLSSSDNY